MLLANSVVAFNHTGGMGLATSASASLGLPPCNKTAAYDTHKFKKGSRHSLQKRKGKDISVFTLSLTAQVLALEKWVSTHSSEEFEPTVCGSYLPHYPQGSAVATEATKKLIYSLPV
jgi:hypothetical protein